VNASNPGRWRVALLACGAVARDAAEIVRRRGWPADVHGLPAAHHLAPERIPGSVGRRLADLRRRYERVIVVYGDCGTGGRLDDVLRRHGAVRPPGAHCFAWFAGDAQGRRADGEPGTYFLTDWLVAAWERAILEGLGLTRFPWLREVYFGGLRRVVYLRQRADPGLGLEARGIAAWLGLPLDIRDTGLEPLERVLAPFVEGA
jgi:hypothetical protein